jgi:hypothetical protein
MGRTKGSKNKPKDNVTKKKEVEPIKPPIMKPQEPEKQREPKEDKFKLKVDGVAPRKESPSIPEILVDGGMLYRFLLELRRDYDNYINSGKDDNKESRKRAIQVIDIIMDYIMRMEKKGN